MRLAVLCLEKGGGLSHCAFELAKAAIGRAEVMCFLATQNEMLKEFEELPCVVRSFPLRRGAGSLLASLVRGHDGAGIASAIQAASPELILDAGSGPWGDVILGRFKNKIPTAQIIHDVRPHPGLRSFLEGVPRLVRGPVPDVFIALSDFSYRQLALTYPHKSRICAKLGVILPNEVDIEEVARARNKLLFFGRMTAYKGLETLLRAFAIARDVNHELQLTIAGPGRIGRLALHEIQDLGVRLENRYVAEGDVPALLSSHGVMVLPYTSATQSGAAAIALGNGMPCIATTVGALPEQILDGRNGILVPPNNPGALAAAMVEVSTNAVRARNMAKEAVRIGREVYSWDNITRILLEDLQRFLVSVKGRK